MIQLVGVALLAIGGLYAWSALKREMKRLDEAEQKKPDDTLQYDPASRRYRPRERRSNDPAA